MKSYGELISLPTFEERFLYLQEGIVHGVGDRTFGSLRYTNQAFYNGPIWKVSRAGVIVRDNGCDLAIPDRPIPHESLIRVHHLNPMDPELLDMMDPTVYDPEFLITISELTHKLLSYGAPPPVKEIWVERRPYDHLPWRRKE